MTKTHCFSGIKSQTKAQRQFYNTYRNMISRCNKPSNKSYADYGGRGIKCLWSSFEEFRDDMYRAYLSHVKKHWRKQTTIDRKNNDWDYCKENCKWSTRKQQNYNKRNNKTAIINWKKYCARDLIEMLWIWEGAAQHRITQYIKWKMSAERVLSKERLRKI